MIIQALPTEIIQNNSLTFVKILNYSYSVGPDPTIIGTFAGGEYASLPLKPGTFNVKVGLDRFSNAARGMANESGVVTYLSVGGSVTGAGQFLFTRIK